MKSFWIVTHGDKAQLEPREVPVPSAGAGEVLIRVRATALNRGEFIVGGAVHGGVERLGGAEVSGEISALGHGVTDWRVGERVMARVRGGFAQYALALTGQLLRIPPRLTFEQAAAIPATFITAYEAVVRYGALRAGGWVLVTGASAGTGVACLLTAKVIGARTIGTSASAQKLQTLRSLGLDVPIHTRSGDFAAQVREATGGKGVDVAVNLVGASLVPEMLRSLAHGGRLAIVGYVGGTYRAEVDFEQIHLNRHHIFGVSNARTRSEERFEATRGFVRDILPAIADGRIAPVVDRVFDFEDMPAARAHLDSAARVGKVVVRVD